MFKNKRLIFAPFIIASSVIVISSAVSCQDQGYLITLHPGDGHSINGQSIYSFKTKGNVELEPTPDIKAGSSFIGWYKNKELTGDVVSFPLTVTASMDLYASYNNITGSNAVTFNTNGGTSVPVYYINEGDEIKSSPITTKEDFVFTNWTDNKGTKIEFPYKPSEDIVLNANWNKLEKGVLTVHTNGGTPPENFVEVTTKVDTYKTEKSIKRMDYSPSTTRANYNFLGWYDNSEFTGNPVSFPYDIKKDCDLYAKWEAVPPSGGYTLELYNDVTAESPIKTSTNISYVAYKPTITKTNYTLEGWVNSTTSETPVEFPLTLEADTKLYAKWKENDKCTVTFKDHGGEQIGDPIKYHKGETINSPFTYEGSYSDYGQFKGWKNGDTEITFPYIIPQSDTLTITANIDINSAIIKVYDSEDTTSVIKDFGNIKSLNSQPEIVIGARIRDYKLDYLCTDNTKQSETKISYPFNVNDKKELIGDNHEIKLYAVWKQDERYYNITLNYGDDVIPKSHIMEHLQGKIKPSAFTKATAEDRVITGWKDEQGKVVDNDTEITLKKDRTFTAVWTYTHRKLTVNRADGSIDYYDHMPVENLHYSDVPQKTKEYHSLKGYTLKGEQSGTTHPLTDSLTLSNDNTTEITEVFERTTSKLTIIYADGDKGISLPNRVIDYQLIKFNTNTLPIETNVDYRIIGFKYKETTYDLNSEINLDTSTTEATIYAVWEKCAFTVTFDYNDSSGKTQVLEHVSLLNSENIPTLTSSGKRFIGYSETSTGEVISLLDKKVTEDKTYYAKWVDATEEFTVKFHLGSLQGLAKFDDGTTGKVTKRTGTNPISYDNCPKVSCYGCSFLGWFISENSTTMPTFPLTTSQTVYARWAPRADFITVSLNVSDGGVFEDTGSSTTLLTMKTTDKWGDIKASIPKVTFGDAFVVSYWKDKDGNEIKDDKTFSADTYLYSVNAEDINDPVSFTDDNWPTLCTVAEKGFSALTASTAYETQYDENGGTFVGLTRKLKYRDVEYTVRVVGEKQDYNTSKTQGLPLTFEFVDVIGIETQDVSSKFSASSIAPKLTKGGTVYNGIQYSLSKNHITQVRKYTPYTGSGTETIDTYLFLPSLYEMNITNFMTYTNKFYYTYYKNRTAWGDRIKNYRYGTGESEITPYSYWSRDCNGEAGAYCIKDDGDILGSAINVGRGIAPMFCIGKIVS